MSKAVLISMQPKWCEKICHKIGVNKDGTPIYEKRVEVRKTRPKLDTPFKVYIYCTKDNFKSIFQAKPYLMHNRQICNGKVIGEFVCDKVDRIAHCGTCNQNIRLQIVDTNLRCKKLDYTYLNECKLTYPDIKKYSNGGDVYGWHISNLVIYDKPKELSEFVKYEKLMECCEIDCIKCDFCKVKRPPQSWCYVEELNNGYKRSN